MRDGENVEAMALLAVGYSLAACESFISGAADILGWDSIDRGVARNRISEVCARIDSAAAKSYAALLVCGANDIPHAS